MSEYIIIPLSKTGKYAGLYEAIISPEDKILAELNWKFLVGKNTLYVAKKHKQKTLYLHRVVMERMLGYPLADSETVDHVDRNGLNCSRGNLRIATQAEQNANQKLNKNNPTGFRGVSPFQGKYRARITFEGKEQHLGLFDTPEQAYAAYCEAAKRYFGDFANL